MRLFQSLVTSLETLRSFPCAQTRSSRTRLIRRFAKLQTGLKAWWRDETLRARTPRSQKEPLRRFQCVREVRSVEEGRFRHMAHHVPVWKTSCIRTGQESVLRRDAFRAGNLRPQVSWLRDHGKSFSISS